MAYTPTEWATGDVITATKLNKAENGIAANSVLDIAVSKVDGAYTPSATYATACEAVEAGRSVRLVYTYVGGGIVPSTTIYYFNLCNADIVTEELAGLYFVSADINGDGALAPIGLHWTSEGISDWPST